MLIRNFRLSIIFVWVFLFTLIIYQVFFPYVFPSQIALYLDEVDYLPVTNYENIIMLLALITYVGLFFFIPFSNYIFLFLFFGSYIYDFIYPTEFSIFSPLETFGLEINYIITGIQIYMIFFTPLSKKFKWKKND